METNIWLIIGNRTEANWFDSVVIDSFFNEIQAEIALEKLQQSGNFESLTIIAGTLES